MKKVYHEVAEVKGHLLRKKEDETSPGYTYLKNHPEWQWPITDSASQKSTVIWIKGCTILSLIDSMTLERKTWTEQDVPAG